MNQMLATKLTAEHITLYGHPLNYSSIYKMYCGFGSFFDISIGYIRVYIAVSLQSRLNCWHTYFAAKSVPIHLNASN